LTVTWKSTVTTENALLCFHWKMVMQRRHITLYAQYVLCFKAYALQDGRHNLHTLFFIHASSGLKCYPCFFGSTTLRICFV